MHKREPRDNPILKLEPQKKKITLEIHIILPRYISKKRSKNNDKVGNSGPPMKTIKA